MEDATILQAGTTPAARLAWVRGVLVDKARSLINQNWGRATMLARSLINPSLYSRPPDVAAAQRRVQANWKRYRSVYVLFYVVLLVYTILSSPLLLLGLVLIGGSWVFLMVLHQPHEVVTVRGWALGRREKLLVLVPGSIIILPLSGAAPAGAWGPCLRAGTSPLVQRSG